MAALPDFRIAVSMGQTGQKKCFYIPTPFPTFAAVLNN
jgi:hypothetical protein